MPVLWRYLLTQFLKVFALVNLTFIAILFVSRLKQIAELASLGASGTDIFLFGLYLIPYILPIAIPVSCLIASVILYQRLSHENELTAMRSGGLAVRQVIAPVLMAGAGIALLNFFVASELATHSHMLGKRLQAQAGTLNPLLLLQNTKLLRLGDIYVDMHSNGESADDVKCVVYNPGSQRLTLLGSERLEMVGEELRGQNSAIVTSLPVPGENFDHLIIENQHEITTPVSSFAHLIKQAQLRIKNDHLRLRLLLTRLRELRGGEGAARCRSEIARRVSVALAAFTFTLIGCAFGLGIGRQRRRRGLVIAVALCTLFLTCFSVAGGLDGRFGLACSLYLVPHGVIAATCVLSLRRVTRGIE